MATEEQREDLLLACRYGDLDEVKQYIAQHGASELDVSDERRNTVLHFCAANGHADVLQLLLDTLPEPQLLPLLAKTNESGSTAIHWAVSNNQVECVKRIVEHPSVKSKAVDLLAIKNAAGRDAFDESMWAGEGCEEVSGYIEGFLARELGEDGDEAEPAKGSAAATAEAAAGQSSEGPARTADIAEDTGKLSIR